MSLATLTNSGQMTIPNDVLVFFGMKTGDVLDFVIEKNHVVLCQPTLDIRELKGILKRTSKKTVSIEDMNAAIIRGAIGEPE